MLKYSTLILFQVSSLAPTRSIERCSFFVPQTVLLLCVFAETARLKGELLRIPRFLYPKRNNKSKLGYKSNLQKLAKTCNNLQTKYAVKFAVIGILKNKKPHLRRDGAFFS